MFRLILTSLATLGLLGSVSAQHSAHTHSAHTGRTMSAPQTKAGTLPLKVSGATVMAVPPSIKDTSAVMTLTNTSKGALKLTGVSGAVFQHGMLMKTVKTGQMLGMQMTPLLIVPAGGKLVLKPSGDHLMLMGLKRPLKVGEQVALTLRASDGRTLTVKATVRKP